MRKQVFEPLDSVKFSTVEVERMKRIKGGATANTVTVYSNNGGVRDDGNASQDGITDD